MIVIVAMVLLPGCIRLSTFSVFHLLLVLSASIFLSKMSWAWDGVVSYYPIVHTPVIYWSQSIITISQYNSCEPASLIVIDMFSS